ncbi:MAG: hypothetical protein KatS3mg015_2746 [Fimbriimonadales bacterium]|nr:MAG: hypothetical protein KatS3mg015_2746 [Fimbriimonadales bacterium]
MAIYVVWKGDHDYEPALQVAKGPLIYMTEGYVNQLDISAMRAFFKPHIERMTEEDALLLSGPTIMNVVAAALALNRLGMLRLLLYRRGRYYERILTPLL